MLRLLTCSLLAAALLMPAFASAALPGANGKIAFVSGRDGNDEIYVMDPDGSNQTRLTQNAARDKSPTWSPDGRQIAFLRDPDSRGLDDVMVIDADGTNERLVKADEGIGSSGLSYSPDGARLVYAGIASVSGSFGTNITRLDVDGSNRTELTDGRDGGVVDLSPDFSPDGQQIVFQRDNLFDDGDEIFVMGQDGSGQRRVLPAAGPVSDLDPDFTPDGRIAFWGRRAAEPTDPTDEDVFVVGPDGSGLTRILSPGEDDSHPAFSPDGTKIVLERSSAGIVVTASDGTSPVTLTRLGSRPDWQRLPAAVTTVTQRPEARTRNASEVFRFALVPGFEGSHKCSIDGSTFQSCNSGTTANGFLVSDLSEGAHRLEVFFDVQGTADDGPITTVEWTVDRTGPDVQITSGPPVSTSDTSATFTFASGATDLDGFRCSLDGGPSFLCRTPDTETGLAPGTHTFSVTALDDLGNESSPAEARWQIAAPAPPAGGGEVAAAETSFTCSLPNVPRIAFGVIVAVGVEACLDATADPDRFTSRRPVLVNGIGIVPDAGTEIRIARDAANGSVVTTGGSTLRLGDLSWKLDEGFTWNELSRGSLATINRLFEMGSLSSADGIKDLERERRSSGLKSVFGLNLVAAPKAEFSAVNGGQVTLSLKLAVPNLLRSTPGRLPPGTSISETGVSFEGAAVISNDRGFQWQGKVQIPEFWIAGKFKVKDTSLAFDSALRQFDGLATVEFSSQALPAVLKSRAKAITVGLAFGPPGFPVKKLSLSVSQLDRPIGDGFFLQRAGLQLSTGIGRKGGRVAGLQGSAGVSFLPRLQFGTLFSGEVISIDGSLALTFPLDIEEFDKAVKSSGFELKGITKVLGVQIGDVTVSSLDGVVDISGSIDATYLGVGFVGRVAPGAFVSPVDLSFNIEATGQAILPGGIRAGATDIFSSRGLMRCINADAAVVGGVSIGYGLVRTDTGLRPLLVTSACDVTPLRVARPRAAAADGSPVSINVPARTRALVVGVQTDAGTAPAATLAGPGGARLVAGQAGSTVKAGGGTTVRASGRGETAFIVPRPAAGRWTVQPGEPARVSFGRDAGPANPRAVLGRADRKGRRTLTIRANSIPGQRLEVYERGASGARRLGRLAGPGGRLRFTAAGGLGPKRRIDVLVVRAGLPRGRTAVARFRVAAIGRPGRPRLGSDRRTITWARA
ncbi:MAG: PD40 domain-containing protein, partial [Solirubrobacterales bacterium]|nr:PD40 domain-containing protein [Solirubrobacterales bacterium]